MVRCDRKELLSAVQNLSSLLPSKTPKPVLENILFQPQSKQINLFATDLEVGMKITLEKAEVSSEEDFLVPGTKLLGILRESEADSVSLKVEDNFCQISAGEDQYKVFSLSPSEFPSQASFPEEPTFKISASKLREMIHKTSFAAATEASRYTMNSVLFDIKSSIFKVIATDGKRLAFMKAKTNIEKDYFLLLPLKGIQQMEKIIPQREEEVEIFIQDNQFLLKTANIVLAIRLFQGTYPPYENVIPKGFPTQVSLHAPTLYRALKKSVLLTTQDSKSVRLYFEDKLLTLYSNDPNIGEAKIPSPLNSEIPEKLEISFNPLLLIDVLKVLDQEDLILELKDSTSPGIIREGEDYIYVVMPLNL